MVFMWTVMLVGGFPFIFAVVYSRKSFFNSSFYLLKKCWDTNDCKVEQNCFREIQISFRATRKTPTFHKFDKTSAGIIRCYKKTRIQNPKHCSRLWRTCFATTVKASHLCTSLQFSQHLMTCRILGNWSAMFPWSETTTMRRKTSTEMHGVSAKGHKTIEQLKTRLEV